MYSDRLAIDLRSLLSQQRGLWLLRSIICFGVCVLVLTLNASANANAGIGNIWTLPLDAETSGIESIQAIALDLRAEVPRIILTDHQNPRVGSDEVRIWSVDFYGNLKLVARKLEDESSGLALPPGSDEILGVFGYYHPTLWRISEREKGVAPIFGPVAPIKEVGSGKELSGLNVKDVIVTTRGETLVRVSKLYDGRRPYAQDYIWKLVKQDGEYALQTVIGDGDIDCLGDQSSFSSSVPSAHCDLQSGLDNAFASDQEGGFVIGGFRGLKCTPDASSDGGYSCTQLIFPISSSQPAGAARLKPYIEVWAQDDQGNVLMSDSNSKAIWAARDNYQTVRKMMPWFKWEGVEKRTDGVNPAENVLNPWDLVAAPGGGFFAADYFGHRVRFLAPDDDLDRELALKVDQAVTGNAQNRARITTELEQRIKPADVLRVRSKYLTPSPTSRELQNSFIGLLVGDIHGELRHFIERDERVKWMRMLRIRMALKAIRDRSQSLV